MLSRRFCVPIGAAAAALALPNRISLCSATTNVTDTNARRLTNLSDKIILITGATSGIGEACAIRLAKHNAKLILIGRREGKLQSLKTELLNAHPDLKIHTVALSVSDLPAVAELPATLPAEFAEVDVLINNAGLALGVSSVENNSVADAATMINTNVLGTIALSSAFLPGMKGRGRGHLVNMGSVAGHYSYATGSVYCASKYAVRAFTESARYDLMNTPLRVTHISPGMVGGTEFSVVRLRDEEKAAGVYMGIEALKAEDVADLVEFALTRPAHVQVADLIVYATNQAGPRDVSRVGPSLGKHTS